MRRHLLRATLGALVFFSAICCTYAQTWNGGSLLSNNWSTGGLLGNWSGAGAPANDGTANVSFGGNNRLSPDIDANWSIHSLTFNSGAGAFTLGSSSSFTLTIQGNGITNNSTSTETISNAVTLGAAQTWSATSGDLTVSGNIVNAGNLLTISGGSNTSVSGVISGSGGWSQAACSIWAAARVKDISETDGRGYYVFESISANQHGEQVCRGTWTNIVRGV